MFQTSIAYHDDDDNNDNDNDDDDYDDDDDDDLFVCMRDINRFFRIF